MPSIYTKTGDTGETSLLGGKRVDKNCIEIDAIGEVDELNSCIGILIEKIGGKEFETVREKLFVVQHTFFTLGSSIAVVQTDLVKVPELSESSITELEQWIDAMTGELAPLTQFILPGGGSVAAYSFYVRAVCRRAERRAVELSKKNSALNPLVVTYLNRLSDLLFVLARWLNMKEGVSEVMWKKTSEA